MAVSSFDFAGKTAERLIRYARVNTQSRPFQGHWPTTQCQMDLAVMLAGELREMGAQDVYLDEKACIVYAGITSAHAGAPLEPIGLIAHMDTAPDAPGENVRPWVLKNYDGGDIVLNREKDIVMRASDYPNLKQYIGCDLVLTDGTTLLGGDDKASIAAIMTLAEYLISSPGIPHAPLRIAFTPDEEVGGLARDLDLKRFDSPSAYTMDGDHLGWFEDETFNASEAKIEILGRSVHTGTAKGIMVNAVDIAAELMAMLPRDEKPQTTSGTEGFYHVTSCRADCEHASIRMIIRDFDNNRFREREEYIRQCVKSLQDRYGEEFLSVDIHLQYRNMKDVLVKTPELTEKLRQAILESGITPVSEPFRGGTDGSSLTWRGLPCPNLSAGYENAHGRFEYVPVQSMAKNVEILLRLCGVKM